MLCKGREEGRAEGEDKKEQEMVLKLHKKQKTAQEISELLEIPSDRVQHIITTYGGSLKG
jgi:predicted transposase YdaD